MNFYHSILYLNNFLLINTAFNFQMQLWAALFINWLSICATSPSVIGTYTVFIYK